MGGAIVERIPAIDMMATKATTSNERMRQNFWAASDSLRRGRVRARCHAARAIAAAMSMIFAVSIAP